MYASYYVSLFTRIVESEDTYCDEFSLPKYQIAMGFYINCPEYKTRTRKPTEFGLLSSGLALIWEGVKTEIQNNILSMPAADRLPYLSRLSQWFDAQSIPEEVISKNIETLRTAINDWEKDLEEFDQEQKPYRHNPFARPVVISNTKTLIEEYKFYGLALDILSVMIDEGIQILNQYNHNESAQAVNNEGLKPKSFVDERKNVFNPPMPLDEVNTWFMLLANTDSTNKSPFLTVDQVRQFIERAFVGNVDLPKITLNHANREKLFTWKIFYQYYLRCTDSNANVERTIQCRDKYIRLLTDNFTNFTFDEVKANFSKSNQATRDWNIPV